MRSPTRAERDLSLAPFVIAACALPLVSWALHRSFAHADVAFFHEWTAAFRASSAFYRDGPGLNYPIVGVLIVCGPAALAGVTELTAYTQVLKGTIVIGEIVFVLACAWLASSFGVARPRWTALAIYALPSSWAGSAWWGQTDVWGSALLITSACALVRYRREGARRWIVIGMAAAVLALSSKQLTWFAAPALLVLAALGLARHRDRIAAAIVLVMPLALFAADPFLTLPDGFRSHLAFVLARGSAHGQLAVASGASVWSLVAPGGTPAEEVRFLGVSSFTWGWALWVSVMIASAVAIVRRGLRDRDLVLAAGIGQLAMATLLTGVHERYLVHAIPLVLLASTHRSARALGVIVAILAGLFVLLTLHPDVLSAWCARPEPLAIVSLAWLALVLVRLHQRQTKLGDARRRRPAVSSGP